MTPTAQFAVGHRVVTKSKQPIYPNLTGYYGHVVEVEVDDDDGGFGHGPLLWIQFQGRVGGEVNPVYMQEQWACWSSEVEHAD